MTPAWIVCAWPPVLWQARATPELHLVHLGTSVLTQRDRSTPCSGQTVWGAPSTECSAGVAWDWIELRQGVVALADPFGLITNIRLLDAEGHELSATQAVVRLNELVHTLPWQNEVQRAQHQLN